ncbi:hypothetical protein H5410_000948 [Solanum commersonii]|uniref:Uncharacterized protein n=1 Tax=Solanum commersonii TaxID=4109 RepID=A0A9J6AYQ5_SOLCO|nr:hypothetical protein H5410_000948 [Solanum commersonii]
MKDLWNELDVMVLLPSCSCEESSLYVTYLKSQQMLQFLMGLNESYYSLRSSILSRNDTMTMNEAYAIITQDESQRSLGVVDHQKDPLTLLAGRAQGYRPRKPGSNRGSTRGTSGSAGGGIPCTHYGYPEDFKSRRKSSQQAQQEQPAHPKLATNASSNDNHKNQGSGNFLTEQQYQELLGKQQAHSHSNNECVSSMAGIHSLLSNELENHLSDKVQVPIGGRAQIKGVGTASIFGAYSMKNTKRKNHYTSPRAF